MPVFGSKRSCRLRPLSITKRTPSMVTELSAIPLASTSLPSRFAGQRFSASLWRSRGSWPWRGQICQCLRASACSSRSRQRSISASPGRNTNTPLPVGRSRPWVSTARSTCWGSGSSARGGWCRVSTGWARPWLVSSVASGSRERRSAMSKVADISIRLRSGRSKGAASRSRAKARSASRRRS